MNNLPSYSRFVDTDKTVHNGNSTYGRWVEPSFLINADTAYINFVVTPYFANRPDRISLLYYGTDVYWWVIVAANAPRDTLNWPASGDTIKVPSQSVIASVL